MRRSVLSAVRRHTFIGHACPSQLQPPCPPALLQRLQATQPAPWAVQMTKMLDLLDSFLDELGHKACRIDGSVPWQDRCATDLGAGLKLRLSAS